MSVLIKDDYKKENIISYGNMFLIGNGHLGYRGTLEEYSKEQMVGLNVVGEYDRFEDKWRESINMPNPFFIKIYINDVEYSVLNKKPIEHYIRLDLRKASFRRHTEFDKIIIDSTRFIPFGSKDEIYLRYQITIKKSTKLKITMGFDPDIYEINGPHFRRCTYSTCGPTFNFKGKTNEGNTYYEKLVYNFTPYEENIEPITNHANETYDSPTIFHKGEVINFYAKAVISKEPIKDFKFNETQYGKASAAHYKEMRKKWNLAGIKIKGNLKANFAAEYSLYHLLILGNEFYNTSIPARGVSGETYKGAIFWDTEIFLVPFFTLTNPLVARKLLEYRIKTLPGALLKAKEFGYDGAFYAWESQEDGLEACSKYNVTDPVTNEPIRTYFNEKQIHISSDIAYAFFNYMEIINDESILNLGGLDVIIAIAKFNMSYAKKINGKYHLNDVIGPDEYHERINDNAFTSYMALYTGEKTLELLKRINYDQKFINKLEEFLNNLYVPVPNDKHLIEQFSGYFNLEDTTVEVVRSRLRHPQDYWGGKNGVATPTKVIKQADVITLLVLFNDKFNQDVIKANFDYYYPYTEHGSSLSSSMYSIIASTLGYTDIAYEMFMKSASIDLGTNQKMFAGGIYIGGTHPASNGGAYLSIVYGMAGLRFNSQGFTLNPHLPKEIKGLEFKLNYQNKIYQIVIDEDNHYRIGVLDD